MKVCTCRHDSGATSDCPIHLRVMTQKPPTDAEPAFEDDDPSSVPEALAIRGGRPYVSL